jgi:hypothetical protein
MKRAILMGISATLLLSGFAGAQESKPVVLSAAQMDAVTAGAGLPYGKIIIDATGRSFGELIGPAKKAGTSTHSNYAGGAKALVEAVLANPPHPIPGN